jgi:hypothetical protein
VVALEDRVLPALTGAVFTLDSNGSVLSLSGNLKDSFGTFPIETQGTGSLTTKYSGPLVAQWDLAANTINFVQSGTAEAAAINGSWKPSPGGSNNNPAPADYGAKVTIKYLFFSQDVYGALRDLVAATTTSAPLGLTGGGGGTYNFLSKEGIAVTNGTFDYNAGSYGNGSFSVVSPPTINGASQQSSFQDLGNGNYRLTLPISITTTHSASGQTVTTTISGTAVANAVMPTSFVVAGFPSPTTAGDSHTFTVTAKAYNGSTATGYLGSVHFSSSDQQAGLPADYTFTIADNGVHTFSATLKTSGPQSITATDKASSNITGSQSGIVVNPAAASSLVASGFPSPITAGIAGNITITAKDAYGNVATGYSGTVHFTSSDSQAMLPGDSMLTNGSSSFSVTLKTAGSQSITAKDTVNGNLSGTQSGITVNPAAASYFIVAGFPSMNHAGNPADFTVTAYDLYGNVATGYLGTVTFTSSDPAAQLPDDYPFTAGDLGNHTFSATLNTPGNQSITAADTADGTINGTQYNLGVRIPAEMPGIYGGAGIDPAAVALNTADSTLPVAGDLSSATFDTAATASPLTVTDSSVAAVDSLFATLTRGLPADGILADPLV